MLSFSNKSNCSEVRGEKGVFSAIPISGFIKLKGTGVRTLVLFKQLEI